ncbi:ABC transporter ATP-binding protein [Edaphobacter sp. HDX4]|uniref:ABC transporter ATP-binding protein n=1 Tax=Edaphobacter sp. HDX4 TaxID=2794064 RepID=UPI002FE520FC
MEDSASVAISLRDVRFSYRTSKPILDVPSLEVPAGHRVFLHGPSGSGKTTLLSLISGVLAPQKGSVFVLGHELTELTASARDTLRGSKIGYIFQGFNLIPYLTVAENIGLPCELHAPRRRRITAGSIAEEVKRLATRLDIHTHLSSPVTQLSTGQQQRVAIARAIIGSPSLVVADEPTSSLDTDRRDAFLSLLTEITEETHATLLFVSHDVTLAPHFDTLLSLRGINKLAEGETA